MQKSQRLWKVYSIFWGIYGRYAWDDHAEATSVSDPPEHIVEIVQNRRLKAYERVLDAGCGTGNYAIALAKAGFQVIGTDYAAGMLAKAQEKVSRDLSENIAFRRENLNVPLNYPAGHFEHVISISVLQAVTNPNFTLGELHRILKPGGTIVLSLPKANSKVVTQSLLELIRYRIDHLEGRTAGKLGLVILKCIGDKYHSSQRWTVPQVQEMLTAMGFEMVSVEERRQILAVAEKC